MAHNTNSLTRKRDEVAIVVAEICEVSENLVQKVRRGERENEQIEGIIMDYVEGKNKLIEHLKEVVSLEKPTQKRQKTTLKDLEKRT